MIDLEQFERRLRQPNAANRTDDDPLVELARLVGGPDDPYKAVFEAQADHRAAGAGETQGQYEADAWEEAEPQDFETEERMLGAGYASFEAEAPRGQSPSALHENAGAFLADDQSEHWRYEDEAAPGSDYESDYESETRSRRPLYIMAAIIVAGIGGIGMSFALKGGSAPHEVAMIKAVDGPAKVQPETTAGADAPDQDASILNRIPQAAPVAVADATEQPLDLSQMPDHASRAPAPGAGFGAASVAVPPSPAQGAGVGQASAEPLSIAGLIEPKKVKTVSVRPDGTVLSYDAAPPTPSVVAAPAHLGAAPAAKAATPKSTARVATTPKPVAAAGATDVARGANPNNPKPVEVADAQAGSAPASEGVANGGAFAVQLAAPSSEQEARDIQLRLIKKYGADIPGFHPSIRKAVSGDKTVYRVRTVGLSKEDATALCQKVLTSGGKCFVAKN
jgi:hypothetical protein